MKKRHLALLVALVLLIVGAGIYFFARDQIRLREVRGSLTISGEYDLSEILVIPEGSKLTIEGGAKIHSNGGGILCYGELELNSSKNSVITFTGKDSRSFFGLSFFGTEQLELEHIVFSNLVLSPLPEYYRLADCKEINSIKAEIAARGIECIEDFSPYCCSLTSSTALKVGNVQVSGVSFQSKLNRYGINEESRLYSSIVARALFASLIFSMSDSTIVDVGKTGNLGCIRYEIFPSGNSSTHAERTRNLDTVLAVSYQRCMFEDIRMLSLDHASGTSYLAVFNCKFNRISTRSSLFSGDMKINHCDFARIYPLKDENQIDMKQNFLFSSTARRNLVLSNSTIDLRDESCNTGILKGIGEIKNCKIAYNKTPEVLFRVEGDLQPAGEIPEDGMADIIPNVVSISNSQCTCKGNVNIELDDEHCQLQVSRTNIACKGWITARCGGEIDDPNPLILESGDFQHLIFPEEVITIGHLKTRG